MTDGDHFNRSSFVRLRMTNLPFRFALSIVIIYMELRQQTPPQYDLPTVEIGEHNTSYQIFTYQEKNSNSKKPCEDAPPISTKLKLGGYFGGIFDGITRSHNSDGSYPNPSPARIVADRLQQTAQAIFIDELNKPLRLTEIPDYPRALRQTLCILNQKLKIFNGTLGFTEETVDYGEVDMPGASVLLSVIAGQTLHIGMIADCTAYVFGPGGGKLITPVQTDVKDAYGRHLRENDPDFNNEKWRKLYRGTYRNNKNIVVEMNGQKVKPGYGALTGEDGAPDFIITREQPLGRDTIVLIASDGILRVPTDEMHHIVNKKIDEKNAAGILPEIFLGAQRRADAEGKPSDDRTAILYIPEQLF